MFSLLTTVLLAGTLGAAPGSAARAEGPSEAPPSQVPPGGYWTISEQRERDGEPRDGEDELTIGSVLFSLGLLRAGAGLLTVWMADRPSTCDEPQGCTSLRLYGWSGLGEGGLLVGTGIVYLAIGGSRRQQYRRWQRGESLGGLHVSPWFLGSGGGGRELTGGGMSLQLRF